MIIPLKIQSWIDKNIFPQRALLSGPGNNFELALQIAAQIQQTSTEKILAGTHPDTIFFRDIGKSFKTSFSDQAKKDEQNEEENTEYLIEWSHKKPISPHRIVILENLERATLEATNKLLKLIEEPPLKTLFLFTTKNHFKLLDTITSRVTIIPTNTNIPATELAEAKKFLTHQNLIQNFRFIEDLEKETKNNPQKKINRQIVFDFLEQCMQVCRHEPKLFSQLELVLETYRSIERNLNVRFTLERLALKIHFFSKSESF